MTPRLLTPNANSREERASLIANDEKAIRRINQQRYFVRSKSGNGEYEDIDSEFGGVAHVATTSIGVRLQAHSSS